MPELPDITVYTERLQALAGGEVLRRLRVLNPFLLRTVQPPVAALEGRVLRAVQRLGKRVVLVLADADDADAPEHFAIVHLMIAGRLHWKLPGAKLPAGKGTLATFEFDSGTLVLTEAGTQRRASLHLVADRATLAALDPGGVELASLDAASFAALLRRKNHTLKRALTDPQLLSGIGNAYSDEILHRARLSPLALTQSQDEATLARLFVATCAVMAEWTRRLRAEAMAHGGWPAKVTAFRPEMAVHGKFGQPCPDCGTPVQRIVQGEREINYCARCQTGGRLLADRALSRLLKASWPKTVDDL